MTYAMTFVQDYLETHGPTPAEEVKRVGREERGLSASAIWRAGKKLGVQSIRTRYQGVYVWHLPGQTRRPPRKETPMNHDPSKPVVVSYTREQDMMRLTLSNLQNHELREILVGLWARLEPADRADHIAELEAYQYQPASWLSPIASAIARPELQSGYINLTRARRFEHGELPGNPGGDRK